MRAVFAVVILCTFIASTLLAAEPADPNRPPAIETQEVPVVPPEIFDALNQYRNIRGASFQGWAPDGRGILIRTTFGNSAQLHRVYEPSGRREQVTFFDEPCGGGFIREATDGSLLLTMSRGGSENDQLYFLDAARFQMHLLTDGKSRNNPGAMRHDGGLLVYTSNKRNGADNDLYIIDPRKPGSEKLLLQVDKQFWGAADWSLDGKTLLMERYVSANESYLGLLDVESGKLTDLPLPTKEKCAIQGLSFAPDGKHAYLAIDAQGEFQQLARLDLRSGEYTWLAEDLQWDVSDIEVDPKTGNVAFTINEDGATRLFLLEAGKRRELKLPLCVASGLEFSPDGKRIGITLVRANAPTDAYSIDLASGELTRWTYSEIGGLDPQSFVDANRIKFKSFDGREIPAYYFKPANASPQNKAPVLISIHGGPEGQYRPALAGMTQYCATKLGMAVIHPNVRGSSGYGKTYLKLDNGMLREDSVKDIGALLDWIAEQPELDASRVAVIGGSYGGYMVLASLEHHGDRIKAGIDIVGIANFITFLESTAPYRRDLRRPEYGDERVPEMRAFLERISPTTNVAKIRSALMVAHGKNDPRVPFAEAEQIAAKVRERKLPVWTVYADNEGHGFAKRDNSEYVQAVTVLFLRDSLGLK